MEQIAVTRLSYDDVHLNLALEEILLRKVASELLPPLVRIWHNPESVILGISRSIQSDLFIDNIRDDNIPLARRISGGGTVYHDSGTISFSFFFPWRLLGFDDDPRRVDSSTIKPFMNIIIETLKPFGLEAYHEGISDVFVNGKKISGNAQKRVRQAILHHGTILLNANLTKMNRYLKVPPEREGIPHDKFVTSLKELGVDLNKNDIFNAMHEHFAKQTKFKVTELDLITNEPRLSDMVSELAEDNYRKPEWIFRKP